MSLFSSRRRRRRTSASATATTTRVHRRRRRNAGRVLLAAGVVLLIVAVAAAIFFGRKQITAAREEAAIQDVVSELRYACNNLDADALLNVINPSVADPLRLATALTGANNNEILESVFTGLNSDLEEVDLEQILRSITYEIREIQWESPIALVRTTCTVTVNGETFTRDIYLYMEKISGSWYIMDLEMDLSVDW